MSERINLEFATQFAESAQLTGAFNNESGDLPFGYFEPTSEGKIYWICGRDRDQKITSIFSYDGPDGKEKEMRYLVDLDEAKKFRDELILNNWLPIKTPEMKMYHNGQEIKLNRKQKKKLAKKVVQIIKDDPVMNNDINC